MARESIFIDEITQSEIPQFELVVSTHADVIVDIFVQALRECFARHPIYTYVPREDEAGPNFEQTDIIIVDKYTEEALFLPTITTNFNSANTRWLQFSQSPFNTVLKPQMNADGSIKRDSRGNPEPSHFEYTGAYDSSITFNISANDTLEREELTNLLHVLLAESLRDQLMVRGVFVKNVTAGGSTEVPYREDYIYQTTVTAELYSEWKRIIPVGEKLKSIGYDINVIGRDDIQPEQPEPEFEEYLPVYDLENQFYVVDDFSGEPVIPCLELDAELQDAPITLVYDSISNNWKVSNFWRKALDEAMIPYENFTEELTKQSRVAEYLKYGSDAITQAEVLRALSLSQGRTLADRTKVIGTSFVFEDGTVELKSALESEDSKFNSVIIDPSNKVTFRPKQTSKNKNILVAKNIVTNSDGEVVSGEMFKIIVDSSGAEQEVSLATSDQSFLTGENLNTMTALDLFMIMQFATQPFKYSLNTILEEIDQLLDQLADMSTSISNRAGKIASITSIKQQLIAKTEQYLLMQPVGL